MKNRRFDVQIFAGKLLYIAITWHIDDASAIDHPFTLDALHTDTHCEFRPLSAFYRNTFLFVEMLSNSKPLSG